jgi:hypothetical protein
MWGFYKKRLRATLDWGNTHSSVNWTHKCGCVTDHYFTGGTDPRPKGSNEFAPRTVVVHPCLKHTGKFFRTRWR